MKGFRSSLVLIVGVCLVAGCRLDGTWTVIALDPPARKARESGDRFLRDWIGRALVPGEDELGSRSSGATIDEGTNFCGERVLGVRV